MTEGDAGGKPFSFPKPEIAIEPCFIELDQFVTDFEAECPDLPTYENLYTQAFGLAAKFGTLYFDNMLAAYRGSGEGIFCYQCCAYNFSTSTGRDPRFEDKLQFRDGSHFSMSSWMVVSTTCRRLLTKTPCTASIRLPTSNTNIKYMMDRAVEDRVSVKCLRLEQSQEAGVDRQAEGEPATGWYAKRVIETFIKRLSGNIIKSTQLLY